MQSTTIKLVEFDRGSIYREESRNFTHSVDGEMGHPLSMHQASRHFSFCLDFPQEPPSLKSKCKGVLVAKLRDTLNPTVAVRLQRNPDWIDSLLQSECSFQIGEQRPMTKLIFDDECDAQFRIST